MPLESPISDKSKLFAEKKNQMSFFPTWSEHRISKKNSYIRKKTFPLQIYNFFSTKICVVHIWKWAFIDSEFAQTATSFHSDANKQKLVMRELICKELCDPEVSCYVITDSKPSPFFLPVIWIQCSSAAETSGQWASLFRRTFLLAIIHLRVWHAFIEWDIFLWANKSTWKI